MGGFSSRHRVAGIGAGRPVQGARPRQIPQKTVQAAIRRTPADEKTFHGGES